MSVINCISKCRIAHLCFMFFLFFSVGASAQIAQTTTENLLKYWQLRGRFLGNDENREKFNGFVKVGTSAGMSLPAAKRYPGGTVQSVYDFASDCLSQNNGWPSNPSNLDPRDGQLKKGVMLWGDVPSDMGFYVTMLAFEWDLYWREGQNQAKTVEELYYALKAIQRIDLAGETLYGGMMPNENGFLSRDDVPENFAINYMGRNYDLVSSSMSCRMGDGNDNDCKPKKANPVIKAAFSFDHMIGLLMGLAAVEYKIPSQVSYNGEGLKQLAKSIGTNLITYAHNGGWKLKDPEIDRQLVCRGATGGMFYAYPLSVLGRMFSGDNSRFRDEYSQTIGKAIWAALKLAYGKNDISSVFLSLPPSAAQDLGLPSGQLWQYQNGSGNDNMTQFLQLATASRTAGTVGDNKGRNLINQVSLYSHKQFYDMLGAVFCGYNPKISADWWITEFSKLNCASCNCVQKEVYPAQNDCIHYDLTPSAAQDPAIDNYAYPWTTNNRWEHWMDPTVLAHSSFTEFNGLDYMTAFNIFLYKYSPDGYYNKLNFNITGAIPFYSGNSSVGILGISTNPFVGKAVFNIDATGQVSYLANARFEAGQRISLKPGFTAQEGSKFVATIKDFDCKSNVSDVFGWKTTAGESSDSNQSLVDYFNPTIAFTMDDSTRNDPYDDSYDSTIIKIEYRGDSVIIGLQPCYDVNELNEIVNICEGGASIQRIMRSIKGINISPNPARQYVNLGYELYEPTKVTIKVIDILGRSYENLAPRVDGKQEVGSYKLRVNTESLTPGLYIFEITLGDKKTTRKVSIL